MKEEFRIILAIDEVSTEQADALFEGGFDDAHVCKKNGHVCIVVDDRTTDDLEATIRGAVNDALQAGVPVLRVELAAVEHINSELAAGSIVNHA
jgi:hypothetical protein